MDPLFKSILQILQFIATYFVNFGMLIVIASIIASWLGADRNNQIVRMLFAMTEPIYRPIRRFTRNIPGPFDWAPLIVMFGLTTFQFAVNAIVRNFMAAAGPGGMGISGGAGF